MSTSACVKATASAWASFPEVFHLDDEDYLHILQDEVTPENEHQISEAVRQCPRQAISIVDK
jgi:ferredoxin